MINLHSLYLILWNVFHNWFIIWGGHILLIDSEFLWMKVITSVTSWIESQSWTVSQWFSQLCLSIRFKTVSQLLWRWMSKKCMMRLFYCWIVTLTLLNGMVLIVTTGWNKSTTKVQIINTLLTYLIPQLKTSITLWQADSPFPTFIAFIQDILNKDT